MSTQATGTSIQHSIVVEAPQARAFTVFTEQFDRIKPHEHNLLGGEDVDETVFEASPRRSHLRPRRQRWESAWARVLAVEPPERVVFTWDISASWPLETDHEKTSEVEVRFIPEGPRGHAWSWSTATSNATAKAGKACAPASTAPTAGRCTSAASRGCSRSRCVLPGSVVGQLSTAGCASDHQLRALSREACQEPARGLQGLRHVHPALATAGDRRDYIRGV